jgi:hypothetical protein
MLASHGQGPELVSQHALHYRHVTDLHHNCCSCSPACMLRYFTSSFLFICLCK